MKTTYILFVSLLLTSSLLAQSEADGCDGQHYFYDLYQDIEKVTVQYGTNIGVTGLVEDLYMDIYLPVNNEVDQRPAIVWAFGGGFVFGTREDMEDACLQFARKGYVTATIDYRLYNPLLGIPDSTAVLDIMIKAMHDMRAAVRYLRQDADTDNLYRIDPDRILVGGASAGAITALQTAYLDDEDTVPAYIESVIDANGGLEGSSGDAQNLNYASSAFAVVNLSGALIRKDWMVNSTDIPLVSMHGMEDEIVPFEHGIATADLNGLIVEFVGVDGSGLLHNDAETLGIENYLVAVPGGGHDDIYFAPEYESYRLDYSVNGLLFIYNQLCPQTPVGPPPTGVLEPEVADLQLSPNPVQEVVELSIPSGQLDQVIIYNQQGQLIWQQAAIHQSILAIPMQGFAAGPYFILAFDIQGRTYRETMIKQ